jgi:tripartite-type tricarboxylate transporter receptor subunit TctC
VDRHQVHPWCSHPLPWSKVNALLAQTLSSPDVKDFIARGAYEASPSTPAELSSEMKLAYDRWGAMVKQIGFEKQ